MSTGHDLDIDGFPHGTPDGYDLGCRGTGACPGSERGQSCAQAHVRYAGDYAYRRAVNDGAPLHELQQPERFAGETRTGQKPRTTRPEPKPHTTRPEPERTTRPEPKPRHTRAGEYHGRQRGYRDGCRCDECRAWKSAANRRTTANRVLKHLAAASRADAPDLTYVEFSMPEELSTPDIAPTVEPSYADFLDPASRSALADAADVAWVGVLALADALDDLVALFREELGRGATA